MVLTLTHAIGEGANIYREDRLLARIRVLEMRYHRREEEEVDIEVTRSDDTIGNYTLRRKIPTEVLTGLFLFLPKKRTPLERREGGNPPVCYDAPLEIKILRFPMKDRKQ
jgi:hypothetical protein